MNVGEWIDSGLLLRSWKPSDVGTEFRDDARKMFQLCLDKLAGDAPQAFVPVNERVTLLPQYFSGTEGVRLSTTNDPWVLKFTPTTTDANPARPYPLTNGTWDGIYHLELTTPDGVYHRRQSRSWWKEFNLATGVYTFYVSLDVPFSGTYNDMPFRIHAPEFFLRANISRVQDGVLWTTTREHVVLRPNFFRYNLAYADLNGRVSGRPEYIVRGRHFQLQSPLRTPNVELNDEGNWTGPEAPGVFQYRYTYVWGKRDPEYVAPGGVPDPQWESSPSPVSDKVNAPAVSGASVRVWGLTNIDWMQGFGDSATLRYGHSGIRKRIYRARISSNPGGEQPVENSGIFYFLKEIDGLETEWEDDGTVTPDYYRRLPEVNGYFAYTSYPYPNTRYEMDLRCDRRPDRLFHDYDAPEVEPAAEQALLQLFLSKLALLDKKVEESFAYEDKYKEELKAFVTIQGVRARTLPQPAYRGTPYSKSPTSQTPMGSYRSV